MVLLVVVGIPLFYTQVLNDDQPDALSLPAASAAVTSSPANASSSPAAVAVSESAPGAADSAAASAPAAVGSLDGAWSVGPESIVGYRVKETIFGQATEGVGRTSDVTGGLTVVGAAVTAGKFTADMTTVASDKTQRDGQFRGRIMDTDTHPTATFVTTAPIAVPTEAGTGGQFTSKATGDLTLRGKTNSVTFDITGQKSANGFDITAQIPIVFADFDVPNPTGGPAKVGDEGTLEILLKLVPKS